MKYATFTKLKQSKELRRESIWTFDTETKDGLLGKQLFCWSLATNKGGKNKERKVHSGYTMSEFFILLNSLNDKKKKQSIFVHNLGFDCRFLIDYCLTNAIQYLPVIVGSNTILLYIDNLNYKFIDSFQYILTSQEQAEKDWEIDWELRKIDCNDLFDKKYKDWNESDKNRVIEHNKNDVLALQQILERFRKAYFEVANVDMLQTNSLAGLAIKAFRKCMNTNYVNPFIFEAFDSNTKRKYYEINTEKAEFCRKAYFGGRTECLSHKIVKNAYYVDTVSMFPYNMYSKLYPNGIPTWENNSKKIMESLDSKLSIIECNVIPNVNCNYPILPIKIDNRICFSNIKLHGIWSSVEIKRAIELGYQIELIKALIFPKKCRPFRKFIKIMFKLKSKSKGGKKHSAKITMNSSYGKFGQRFSIEGLKLYVFHSMNEAIDFQNESVDSNYENVMEFNDFYQKWTVIRKEEVRIVKTYQMISWAVFITAYSRLTLVNQMLELEKNMVEIHYCDTDSMVINDLSQIKLGKMLGNWDIEQKFKYFKAIAPKCYVAEFFLESSKIKRLKSQSKPVRFLVKVKGIRKSVVTNIIANSDSIEKIIHVISQKIELPEQYLPIKSSLHLEKKALSSRKMIKQMSMKDEKRITLSDLTTRPIEDKDLTELGIKN